MTVYRDPGGVAALTAGLLIIAGVATQIRTTTITLDENERTIMIERRRLLGATTTETVDSTRSSRWSHATSDSTSNTPNTP